LVFDLGLWFRPLVSYRKKTKYQITLQHEIERTDFVMLLKLQESTHPNGWRKTIGEILENVLYKRFAKRCPHQPYVNGKKRNWNILRSSTAVYYSGQIFPMPQYAYYYVTIILWKTGARHNKSKDIYIVHPSPSLIKFTTYTFKSPAFTRNCFETTETKSKQQLNVVTYFIYEYYYDMLRDSSRFGR